VLLPVGFTLITVAGLQPSRKIRKLPIRLSWDDSIPLMSSTTPISITPAPPENLPNLHDFFAPGGILSQSSLAFEHRRGQYDMARAIDPQTPQRSRQAILIA
jgi:hypothetical protein